MCRALTFLVVFIVLPAAAVNSQSDNDFKQPPVAALHPYYVGMPKDELYTVYPPKSRQNDYQQGREEWIVFDDVLTTVDMKDTIVFYLKDGKVMGWDKKRLPLSPEERLAIIEARHKHSVGASAPSGINYTAQRMLSKEQTRRDKIQGLGRRWL